MAKTAESLTERASRLVERTMAEAEGWLDSIQTAKQLLNAGDIDGLRKLINSWEVPVRVARKTLGLDTPEARTVEHVDMNAMIVFHRNFQAGIASGAINLEETEVIDVTTNREK